MAQENPNRLAEWLLLLRKQWPVARRHLEDWLAAVREEPALIWQTVAVRYAAYGGLLVVLAFVLVKASSWIVPPPPVSAKPVATTADYHVLCTNPQCGRHFVINRKFGFRGFPVECAQCKQRTGAAARKCNSPTCQGQWVVPVVSDGRLRCPVCEGRLD